MIESDTNLKKRDKAKENEVLTKGGFYLYWTSLLRLLVIPSVQVHLPCNGLTPRGVVYLCGNGGQYVRGG